MKKVFAIALAVMMVASVLAVSAFADGAVVSAPTIEAQPGDTVTMNISISNNPGIASMRFLVSADSRLSQESYAGGNGYNATLIDYAVLDNDDDISADGTVLSIVYTVPSDAQPGDVFPVNLSEGTAASFADISTMTDVDLTVSGGAIIIPGPVETEAPTTPEPEEDTPTPTPTVEPGEITPTPAPAVKPTPAPSNPGTSPKTGDSLFIGLCLLAVCGGAAFVVVSKKKSAEK